jgi:hypothetical protein
VSFKVRKDSFILTFYILKKYFFYFLKRSNLIHLICFNLLFISLFISHSKRNCPLYSVARFTKNVSYFLNVNRFWKFALKLNHLAALFYTLSKNQFWNKNSIFASFLMLRIEAFYITSNYVVNLFPFITSSIEII